MLNGDKHQHRCKNDNHNSEDAHFNSNNYLVPSNPFDMEETVNFKEVKLLKQNVIASLF